MSQIDEDEQKKCRQREIRSHMDHPPSKEELDNAFGKIKNGKTAGQSSNLPEMIKVANWA